MYKIKNLKKYVDFYFKNNELRNFIDLKKWFLLLYSLLGSMIKIDKLICKLITIFKSI